MKKIMEAFAVILIITASLFLNSCQKDDGFVSNENSLPELKNATMNTFYGPTVPMGNGVARAWVKANKNGDSESVGISLSEKALQKLPDEPSSIVLFFPKMKGGGFYTHALVDWNPNGHEPEGVYNVAHFDFHFYIISNEERLAIPPKDTTYIDAAPATMFIPPAYFETKGVVPQMGVHWIDALSPEITGGVENFTHTFIWGSYEGKFIFWEPMITIEYLNSHPNVTIPVRQPEYYQTSGWYASNYQIMYSSHPGEYSVALTGLTHHNAE